MWVLCLLSDRRVWTPSRVAQETGLTRPAITSSVDHLVQLGYVRRARRAEDRRNVVLSLTPEGLRRFERFWARQRATLATVAAGLGSADRERLTFLLRKVSAQWAPPPHDRSVLGLPLGRRDP
jgi:DNA-binding MarR family transcriptional regulator